MQTFQFKITVLYNQYKIAKFPKSYNDEIKEKKKRPN